MTSERDSSEASISLEAFGREEGHARHDAWVDREPIAQALARPQFLKYRRGRPADIRTHPSYSIRGPV
jgi:hypothetical protein